MKKYNVSIPITGSISFVVEAADKKTAIEEAWKAYGSDLQGEGELAWEAVEQICKGNVFHGALNEIVVDYLRPTKDGNS